MGDQHPSVRWRRLPGPLHFRVRLLLFLLRGFNLRGPPCYRCPCFAAMTLIVASFFHFLKLLRAVGGARGADALAGVAPLVPRLTQERNANDVGNKFTFTRSCNCVMTHAVTHEFLARLHTNRRLQLLGRHCAIGA